MIPAHDFKEKLILLRNITVEDRRFNANSLGQLQPFAGSTEAAFLARVDISIILRMADDAHWPFCCG
jgi:hypothetical protein